jgi:hypothetical protein
VNFILRADAREDSIHQSDLADAAGTNDPICAINTISAVCRRYVDLPDMFGPVMTRTTSPFSKMTSFGM